MVLHFSFFKLFQFHVFSLFSMCFQRDTAGSTVGVAAGRNGFPTLEKHHAHSFARTT